MELGNYKIKVTTEAESKAAQELFFELGYYWNTGLGVKNLGAKFLYVKNSKITMGFCSDNFSDSDSCELTITQLRDLVAQSKPKEQGLISGKEALIALANGEEVEYWCENDPSIQKRWTPIKALSDYKLSYFLENKPRFEFRLKPRTITLNIEIPAPFEPKNNEIIWILNTERECGYKLKLAHDYAMKHLEGKFYTESEQWRVAQAWEYVDMMLAEQEKRTDKTRPAVLDDFQVDWNQAPKDAFFWSMDANRACHWFATKPRIIEVFTSEWIGGGYDVDTKAPSFNYQGDWKSSLQERK